MPTPAAAQAPRSVTVNTVDPTEATFIIQAVEGAAYVDEPLTFVIDSLTRDRERLRRQRAVLFALGGAKNLDRNSAASLLQRKVRKYLVVNKLASSTTAEGTSLTATNADGHDPRLMV